MALYILRSVNYTHLLNNYYYFSYELHILSYIIYRVSKIHILHISYCVSKTPLKHCKTIF